VKLQFDKVALELFCGALIGRIRWDHKHNPLTSGDSPRSGSVQQFKQVLGKVLDKYFGI